MAQTHLPRLRPAFPGQPAPYRAAGGAVVTMPRTRAVAADDLQLVRRRLALFSVTLAFLLGAGAIGVAIGWLPGM